MTILWCGGEDVDFYVAFNKPGYRTSDYDSTFARGAVGSGIMCVGTQFPGGGITSGWAGAFCIIYPGRSQTLYGLTDINGKGIWLYDSGSVIYVKKYDGTTWTNISSSIVNVHTGSTSNVKFDMQIINYGASATVNVYANSINIIYYSGDISVSGVTTLDRMSIYCTDVPGGLQQAIVADTDTRALRVKTLVPDSAGDSSTNWTGTYTDINELTLSTTNSIYSSTDNADFQANLTGMPTGTYTVKAVKVYANIADFSATMGVQLGVKTNSTVNVGTTQACSAAWETKERLMELNPVTGLAWTSAEIDALQLNIRAKVL